MRDQTHRSDQGDLGPIKISRNKKGRTRTKKDKSRAIKRTEKENHKTKDKFQGPKKKDQQTRKEDKEKVQASDQTRRGLQRSIIFSIFWPV